ncbi:MAG: hypothetical protein ABS68_01665 [Niastella sp. SCN 39-18]|nr:hypothetical protein [Sphingobacteriales bacterium]ODT54506.1 MAG: hypothetical protein ABS68_01665 [Niastella sp. SCN 39-18]OJW10770.1 MAG: hypothetical protein BGO53_14435 [Sphingobacteriales bacterium 39-19]
MKVNKEAVFNRKTRLLFIMLIMLAGLFFYFKKFGRSRDIAVSGQVSNTKAGAKKERDNTTSRIDELTREDIVVNYIKAHGELPPYYITKSEARRLGWNPSTGNLCEVAAGKAIGGDIFTNRQALLPVKIGRTWYEADLDYACGRRNAHRVLFSSDRLLFVTYDHYKTVEEK